MRRRLATLATLIGLVLGAAVAPALANTGYEGRPGNQSGHHGGGGNTGYEGQPGNQSNN